MEIIRPTPVSKEAEQAVLGSMILNKDVIGRAAELLTFEDFYSIRNGNIFKAIVEMFEKQTSVDLVTVAAELESKKQLEDIGGMVYLAELFNTPPVTTNIDQYAKIVKEKATLRHLIDVAKGILNTCYDQPDELEPVLDKAEQAIFSVTQSRVARPYRHIREVVSESYTLLEQLYENKAAITGVPSGLVDLDQQLAGFQPSDMIILAARPSVGKTALCLTFAVNAAVYNKVPAIIFSLEMSRVQLAFRMMAMESRLNLQSLRTGTFRGSLVQSDYRLRDVI